MKEGIAKPLMFWIALAIVMLICYRLCQIFNWGSYDSCRWAIGLVMIAGMLGFLPLLRAKTTDVYAFLASFLAGALLRLLLTAGGALLIVKKVDIDDKWFLIWTAILYLVYLALETVYALSISHKFTWKKPDFFEDDGNEIDIS